MRSLRDKCNFSRRFRKKSRHFAFTSNNSRLLSNKDARSRCCWLPERKGKFECRPFVALWSLSSFPVDSFQSINNISFHISTRKIARAFFADFIFVEMAKYKNKIYFTVERLIEEKESFSDQMPAPRFSFRIINSNFILCQRRRVLSHVILNIENFLITSQIVKKELKKIKRRKMFSKTFRSFFKLKLRFNWCGVRIDRVHNF